MCFSKTFWYPFITIKLSQTVCYAGEANDPTTSSTSPTEPTEEENLAYPNEAPKHKNEAT